MFPRLLLASWFQISLYRTFRTNFSFPPLLVIAKSPLDVFTLASYCFVVFPKLPWKSWRRSWESQGRIEERIKAGTIFAQVYSRSIELKKSVSLHKEIEVGYMLPLHNTKEHKTSCYLANNCFACKFNGGHHSRRPHIIWWTQRGWRERSGRGLSLFHFRTSTCYNGLVRTEICKIGHVL